MKETRIITEDFGEEEWLEAKGTLIIASPKHVWAAFHRQQILWRTSLEALCPLSHPAYNTVTLVLTHSWHIYTQHKDIHQAVAMTMNEVAASWLGDRWGRQMVPSKGATKWYQLSSLSNPLTSHILFFQTSVSFPHVYWMSPCHMKKFHLKTV